MRKIIKINNISNLKRKEYDFYSKGNLPKYLES